MLLLLVCYVWKRLANISVEKIGGNFIFAAAREYTFLSRSKNSRPCISFELNKSFNYSNIKCFIILYMIRNATICQKHTKCYGTSDHGNVRCFVKKNCAKYLHFFVLRCYQVMLLYRYNRKIWHLKPYIGCIYNKVYHY